MKINAFKANYQRNTNQNHNEILPHTYHNGYHQTSTNNKCWQECGEGKSLFAAGKNVI